MNLTDNNNNNSHCKANRRSHRHPIVEQRLQQQQSQPDVIKTSAKQAHQGPQWMDFVPGQSLSGNLHTLEPAGYSDTLKRKKLIKEVYQEEETQSNNAKTVPGPGLPTTKANNNIIDGQELDDELEFDYEPVLIKILNEKKLVSILWYFIVILAVGFIQTVLLTSYLTFAIIERLQS